jgi:hypothetical protein
VAKTKKAWAASWARVLKMASRWAEVREGSSRDTAHRGREGLDVRAGFSDGADVLGDAAIPRGEALDVGHGRPSLADSQMPHIVRPMVMGEYGMEAIM